MRTRVWGFWRRVEASTLASSKGLQSEGRRRSRCKTAQAVLLMLVTLVPGIAAADLKGIVDTPVYTHPAVYETAALCKDPAYAGRSIETFANQLDQLFQTFPEEARAARMLGMDALDVLRKIDSQERENLCLQIADQDGFAELAAAASLSDRSRYACYQRSTYFALLGVRTVVDGFEAGLDGVCQASGCSSAVEAKCLYLCIAPFVLRQISMSLSLPMALDDKCSVLQHREEMQMARNGASLRVAGLSAAQANSLIPALNELKFSGVAQGPLETHAQQVQTAFSGAASSVGKSGFGQSGINPALSEINERLADEESQQASFESESIEGLIEAAFSQTQAPSIVQMPEAFGGLLGQVRELVALRISSASGAGTPTSAALAEFRDGDSAFNSAQYRAAYQHYAAAYSAIASLPRSDKAVRP